MKFVVYRVGFYSSVPENFTHRLFGHGMAGLTGHG